MGDKFQDPCEDPIMDSKMDVAIPHFNGFLGEIVTRKVLYSSSK